MHLAGHELALVHNGMGGQRADVGVLVVKALAVPLVLNQLAQNVELDIHTKSPRQYRLSISGTPLQY